MVDEIKKRRISNQDFDKVAEFVSNELSSRKGRKTRKQMETIWKQVDQQIAMEAPETKEYSGNKNDWHSAIQLGALADAQEIIAADIMRQAFPISKRWFQAHTEIEGEIDENGEKNIDPDVQTATDGTLRAMMTQQHADFGFKDRVKLSVKEALIHGGFVAECMWMEMTRYGRGQRESIAAPVWVPHSMWNCYPDPSPSIIGTDLFYQGSMIIEKKIPYYKVMSNPVFINKNKIKKPEKDTDDVTLVRYIGDVVIDRKDGPIQLNNYTIILVDKTLVYAKKNDLNYSNVIYTGYEKDDVRTEYYTSPLIKRSPTHKLATELANRFIDGTELKLDPPIAYDAYDTKLVSEGGPQVHPGSKIAIKGGAAQMKPMDVGDPSFAYTAFKELQQEVQMGTAVDATRAGVSASTDQTAFEVSKKDQKSEIRTVDFLSVLDRQALKPFLYMQHDYNKMKLNPYEFYNNTIGMPNFQRISKADLPKNVVFDVVGSKEVLGEEQRAAKFIGAVQFASQIPQIGQRTNWEEVTEEVWNFSGSKDPERFIVEADPMAEIQQQYEQAIQELQGQIQELAQEKFEDDQEITQLETDVNSLMEQIKIMEEQGQLQKQTFSMTQKIINERHKLEKLMEKAKSENDSR